MRAFLSFAWFYGSMLIWASLLWIILFSGMSVGLTIAASAIWLICTAPMSEGCPWIARAILNQGR